MQDYQKKLLQLLKEIDAICRKHDITYYCSGGTVIGAVRHQGFIPWDDDIDICMMRPDFERFCEVFKTDPPEDRYLLYNENDSDYHSTIPRYVEADSTSFCRYHQLGHVPAGVSIDVFILESVSDDPAEQREFIRKFFLYSDFVMPFYCFSHRVPDNDLDDFYKYLKLRDDLGEAEVIKLLHDELFPAVSENSCFANSNSVCLLWASSPSIFPKSIFDEPVYMPFEDIEVPIPRDWCQYLYLEYGMDWMQVPYNDIQGGHISINRLDTSYEHCYQIRDRLFSPVDLNTVFYERKSAAIEYEKAHRALVAARSSIKADAVRISINKRLSDRKTSPAELYKAGNFASILDIYDDYLDLQLSKWFIGSRTRFHYYRYMYPLLVDISEEELNILTRCLLHAGRFSELKKLLDAYIRNDLSSPVVAYAYDALRYICKIESLYYRECYGDCIEICDRCTFEELTDFTDQYKLACRAVTEPGYALNDLQKIYGAEQKTQENGSMGKNVSMLTRKALGDAFFGTGNTVAASKLYKEILSSSRNGMFWKDICSKTSLTADMIFDKAKYALSRYELLYKVLLDEIISVCNANDIKYVLSPELTIALFNHSLGVSREKHIIYMTDSDALKFIAAFDDADTSSVLSSWKNNDNISDFVLEYMLADSVYVNFRHVTRTVEEGLGFTIRILRTGRPYSLRTLRLRVLEHQANKGLRSKARLFTYLLMHSSADLTSQTDFYYYINKPDSRPVRKVVSGKMLKNAALVEIDGSHYRVPADFANSVKKKEELSAISKRTLPENMFNLTDIEISDFKNILDTSVYGNIDIADHDRRASLLKTVEAKVDSIWGSIVAEEAASR